jgi:hypothetical protein
MLSIAGLKYRSALKTEINTETTGESDIALHQYSKKNLP